MANNDTMANQNRLFFQSSFSLPSRPREVLQLLRCFSSLLVSVVPVVGASISIEYRFLSGFDIFSFVTGSWINMILHWKTQIHVGGLVVRSRKRSRKIKSTFSLTADVNLAKKIQIFFKKLNMLLFRINQLQMGWEFCLRIFLHTIQQDLEACPQNWVILGSPIKKFSLFLDFGLMMGGGGEDLTQSQLFIKIDQN